ncbi:hypothetical protein HDU79_006084 [Rhizoclosmatium sp. JEL0117]|nr:hypothetical protein HDU79_006084 [Rhizoclosmatium sp. JEL0117]
MNPPPLSRPPTSRPQRSPFKRPTPTRPLQFPLPNRPPKTPSLAQPRRRPSTHHSTHSNHHANHHHHQNKSRDAYFASIRRAARQLKRDKEASRTSSKPEEAALDLGRDSLRRLMQEAGMADLGRTMVTREDLLRYDDSDSDDCATDDLLLMDTNYTPYCPTGYGISDDEEDDTHEGEDDDDMDLLELDLEIENACVDLGIASSSSSHPPSPASNLSSCDESVVEPSPAEMGKPCSIDFDQSSSTSMNASPSYKSPAMEFLFTPTVSTPVQQIQYILPAM